MIGLGSCTRSAVIPGGPAWPPWSRRSFAVILIFMDQQITAVIVNRPENKLRKGLRLPPGFVGLDRVRGVLRGSGPALDGGRHGFCP